MATGYTPPPTIKDADTTGKVLRGLEHVTDDRVRALSGLHPATLGCAVDSIITIIIAAAGNDQSRIDDALAFVKRRLDRVVS